MKISSKDNKVLKLAKKLHSRKERKENNLFIIEGEKLIKEAIENNLILPYIFHLEDREPDFKIPSDTELYEIPLHFMEFISTTDSAPPYLALAETFSWKEDYLSKTSLLLIVNELQDPGNFGTIIRSAEASGVNCIYATKGTVELFNPKVVRASMGSLFRVPIVYIDKLTDFLEDIEKDWQIILTTPYTENKLNDFDYTKKDSSIHGK